MLILVNLHQKISVLTFTLHPIFSHYVIVSMLKSSANPSYLPLQLPHLINRCLFMMCRYLYLCKCKYQFLNITPKSQSMYKHQHVQLLPAVCCYCVAPVDSPLVFLTASIPTNIQSTPSIWKLSSGCCYTSILISASNIESSYTFNSLFHNFHQCWYVELSFTQCKTNLCFTSCQL